MQKEIIQIKKKVVFLLYLIICCGGNLLVPVECCFLLPLQTGSEGYKIVVSASTKNDNQGFWETLGLCVCVYDEMKSGLSVIDTNGEDGTDQALVVMRLICQHTAILTLALSLTLSAGLSLMGGTRVW